MRDGRWKFTIKGYASSQHPKAPAGTLLLETTHASESSRDAEIGAWRARMKRGEVAYIDVISHIEPFSIERLYD